jgi:nitrogen fixation NifU-like protein
VSALYGAVIAEHTKNPRNEGSLDNPDLRGEGLNPLCGDKVALELRVADGRIAEARYSGEGCMVSLGSASVLTEILLGKSLDEAAALQDATLLAALQTELRPSRVQCAVLSLQVLRDLLSRGRAPGRG